MFSSNLWDVSRLVHEERLQVSKNHMLMRQVVISTSPLVQAHALLRRMMLFFF
jgi:hypothetical protein